MDYHKIKTNHQLPLLLAEGWSTVDFPLCLGQPSPHHLLYLCPSVISSLGSNTTFEMQALIISTVHHHLCSFSRITIIILVSLTVYWVISSCSVGLSYVYKSFFTTMNDTIWKAILVDNHVEKAFLGLHKSKELVVLGKLGYSSDLFVCLLDNMNFIIKLHKYKEVLQYNFKCIQGCSAVHSIYSQEACLKLMPLGEWGVLYNMSRFERRK